MTKWVFVTGGSGYIGSHVAAHIKEHSDYSVMIIDKRCMELPHTRLFCDTFADEDFAGEIALNAIRDYKPAAIIHLAASSTVGPSMVDPGSTWDNNVTKTIKMLETCSQCGVKDLIFASSSGVYADSDNAVDEISPIYPISPYATTKLTGELALKDWYGAFGIRSVSFRFFNVAGSHTKHNLGELNGSSHLLAKIMESMIHNVPFTVFGRDWPTPDGTAIRDYTHVMDVSDAILAALDWLPTNPGAHVINLGGGQGHSVQDVINMTENLLSKELPYRYGDRRHGDSAKRYSNSIFAKQLLSWEPKRNLHDMILDSYKWYNSQVYQQLTQLGIRQY